jgi:hypothetical protein
MVSNPEELSDLLARHCPWVHLESGLGHGGYGTVLGCTAVHQDGNQKAALKFEVRSSNDHSCLEQEALVYQTFRGSVRRTKENPENPIPSLVRAFNNSMAHSYMKIPINGDDIVRILCIEYVDLEPQEILKKAHIVFKAESRIEASFREISLKLLHASLFIFQNGVAHLDFKPQHLAFRRCTRELRILDWGLAELKGRNYQNWDEMPTIPKRAKTQRDPSFGFPPGVPGLLLPRFAKDHPGTAGSRPPFGLDGTFDTCCRIFIWQTAVILLGLFLRMPSRKIDSKQYEKDLYDAVKMKTLESFMSYALGGNSCPNASCRQCLELVYNLFQDALSKQDPVKTISRALLSEFCLVYKAETVELERQLSDEGVLVEGRLKADGRIQRPLVLVRIPKFGLVTIILLDSKEGETANSYCGRVMESPAGNLLSSLNFCFHGLPLGPGKFLNGEPCDLLPLMHMIELRAVGSMVLSSRRNPGIDTPGNIFRPDRLRETALKTTTIHSADVSLLDMVYRRNSKYGQPQSWSYNWANGCGDITLPGGMIEENKRWEGLIDDLDILDEKTLEIVMKHRLALLDGGKWSDADWNQCTCDRRSLECSHNCKFLQCFADIRPYTPELKPAEGMVWVPPKDADAELICSLTVLANRVVSEPESPVPIIAGFGACLVSGVSEMFPEEFANAVRHAKANCSSICKFSVFIYPPKNVGNKVVVDVGRGEKRLGYLKEDSPIGSYLLQILNLIRPGYKPLEANRAKQTKVKQLELIWQLPPPPRLNGQIQVQHVDATVRGMPGGGKKDGGFLPRNVQVVVDGRGPLSVFVPFDEDYYVIVWLTGHKLAIECMKHFSRHFVRAQEHYFKQYPESTLEQFQGVWCGGTVQYLRELCPDAKLKPVRIPVRKGDVLAMSSFLPHSGPSVPGLRGFILAGPEVLHYCFDPLI